MTAKITITVEVDGRVLHRYVRQRQCAPAQAPAAIRLLIARAVGWLQAYTGAVEPAGVFGPREPWHRR